MRQPHSNGTAAVVAQDQALVIARHGAEVILRDRQAKTWRANLRRKQADVVVGDTVSWRQCRGACVVDACLPRHNVLRRAGVSAHAPPRSVAANLGRLLVMLDAAQPDWLLLDRLLGVAWQADIPPAILLNKIDQLEDGKLIDLQARLQAVYGPLDCPVWSISAVQGEGVQALAAVLNTGRVMLIGPSGVGKSTLSQALVEADEDRDSIRVNALSASGAGRHTTTSSRLYGLAAPALGELIDSPGVRRFIPDWRSYEDCEQAFPDIASAAASCRFRNCRHSDDTPGCAVQQTLNSKQLDAGRWQSFQQLAEELRQRLAALGKP